MEAVPDEQDVITVADFAALLEAKGFRPFTMKSDHEAVARRYQRCYTDAYGKQYFLNVRQYQPMSGEVVQDRYWFTFQASFQNGEGEYFNVETLAWRVTGPAEGRRSLGEIELFFFRAWKRLECLYYETYELN